MNKTTLITIQLGLLVAGAAASVQMVQSFREDGKLTPEPNVLHLKRSPFGKTLALAMRGPVDIYFHRGAPHSHGDGEVCHEDHEHGPECDHGHDHGHDHGPDCDHDHDGHHHHEEVTGDAASNLMAEVDRLLNQDDADHDGHADAEASSHADPGLRDTLLARIKAMRTAYYSRTNNRADTAMHRAFIMGETQKRLKVSYEMDPTNIACYGSYFLFLSEAVARVEGKEGEEHLIIQRQNEALKLSHLTLAYCLKFPDEAPAMITAATASHDFLQIYLTRPELDLKVAGEFLQTLDSCLMQYEAIRRQMKEDGRWERYSVHRVNEMEGAYSLVRKLRDIDHEIFSRLSSEAAPLQEEPAS